MKKILAILLSIICLVSMMSGCTLVEEFKEGFKEGYESAQEANKDSFFETDDDTTTDDDIIVDTEKTDDTDDKKEEEEVTFEFGTVSGATYKNEFAGISCVLPSSWVYYSEEEIKALNNITIDKLDEELVEMIKNATIIYDMCAVDNATGSSININFEKLPVYMTTADLETILTNQIGNTKTSLESVGATSVNVLYSKVEVDGKQFDALCNTAEVNGAEIYQTILAFQCENYITYVTVTAASDDAVKDVLSNFSFN